MVAVEIVVVSVTVVVSVVVSVTVVGTVSVVVMNVESVTVSFSVLTTVSVSVEPGSWTVVAGTVMTRPFLCTVCAGTRTATGAPATRRIWPFRCTVTVAASAELPPPTQSPSHAPEAKIAANTGTPRSIRWWWMRYRWPLAPRLGRARAATTGSETAAAAAAATTAGSGSGTTGARSEGAASGTAAAASSLRDGTRRITTMVRRRRTRTSTAPFTTRIPTAMSSRSITSYLTPAGSLPRPDTAVTPLNEVCAVTRRAAMMAGPPVPSTIPDLFDDAVAAAPSKVWLHTDGNAFTFEEAHSLVERAAAALAARGVRPGDLVLATARNTPEYLLAWLGTAYAGGIIVAVNPLAGESELAGLVRQVRPRLVVTDADAPAAVSEAGGEVVDVAALYSEPAGATRPPRPGPDDPAVLIPTSGTTGRSKLVTQTHRAYAMAGEGFPWWMELGPDDRLMTSLPLFHINAPAYSVLGSVAARAGLVLLPRFSASGFLDAARRHGATEFNAIGAMLEILMRQPEREDDADTPLRLCYTGPAPSEARQTEIEERFGLRIVCGYALSESPYGMIWPHGTRPFGTLGTVRQHPRLGTVNEARVIAEGGPVPDGEVGELELRNPAVMQGYWGTTWASGSSRLSFSTCSRRTCERWREACPCIHTRASRPSRW